jgi:taurine dioxygenase
MRIELSRGVLGAEVTGIDLARPLDGAAFAEILRALGRHGVLCFPDQRIGPANLRDFSRRFGSIQTSISGKFHLKEVPEVGILSNIVENGEPVGIADAGQDWHTDMSYNRTIGFANVLHALKVPRRGGKPLGDTVFANMHAAYDQLPAGLKEKLRGATAMHDFNRFWENMRRRPGSDRAPLTSEQRARRPPSSHPVFLTHPVTRRTVLYCNPGYAVRINELDEAESERVLGQLFTHQLEPRFQHVHRWTEGDVLIWDHIGTLHNAVPDYGPEEHRLMHRCQVMADRIFDAAFVQASLGTA